MLCTCRFRKGNAVDLHVCKLEWDIYSGSAQCFFAVNRGYNYDVSLKDDAGEFASMSFTWMPQGLSVSLANNAHRASTSPASHEVVFLFPGAESPRDSMETRELRDGNSFELETSLLFAVVMIHSIKGNGDLELNVIATAL